MRRILICRNDVPAPNHRTWGIGHLPIRQTIIWAGPIQILLQPRTRRGLSRDVERFLIGD